MKMLTMTSAALALLSVGAAEAKAEQPVAGNGPRWIGPRADSPFRGGGHWRDGYRGGYYYPGFYVVEREVPVVVEREVVREVPAAPPPPPPEPRKPFVVGQSYASLPGGCMKMIEGTASYYYCGGDEWYRPVGNQYRAIEKP